MQDVLAFGHHLHRVMLAIQHLQIFFAGLPHSSFLTSKSPFRCETTCSTAPHGSEHCHRMLLQAFDVIRQHFSSDGSKKLMLSANRGRKA
ncbi:hypothetical protein TNCV_2251681 [Trichonephila clavipes]|nr:hypothetical protein TNCV_2251681 [Trichonephila clavipes]